MQTISIYVTCRDQEEARKIGRQLVQRKLAACVSMFPVRSIFRWHEKVQEEYEFAFLAKTTADKFEQAKEEIKRLHSYDVPCIVSFSHDAAYELYSNWVVEETR